MLLASHRSSNSTATPSRTTSTPKKPTNTPTPQTTTLKHFVRDTTTKKSAYARAKRTVLSNVQPASRAYLKMLFLEEEDQVDDIVLQYTGRSQLNGFMLLSRKSLTPWVPPEWSWKYVEGKSGDGVLRERYTHKPTGRVVFRRLGRGVARQGRC